MKIAKIKHSSKTFSIYRIFPIVKKRKTYEIFFSIFQGFFLQFFSESEQPPRTYLPARKKSGDSGPENSLLFQFYFQAQKLRSVLNIVDHKIKSIIQTKICGTFFLIKISEFQRLMQDKPGSPQKSKVKAFCASGSVILERERER